MKLTRKEAAQSVLSQCPPEKREALLERMPWLKAAYRKQSTKPRTKNKRIEDSVQIACCQLLDKLQDTEYVAIPNGLFMGKSHSEGEKWGKVNYMKKQRRMGLKKGAFDMIISFININGVDINLGWEMKREGQEPDDDQLKFALKWRKRGWKTGWGCSVEALVSTLKLHGHPAFQS